MVILGLICLRSISYCAAGFKSFYAKKL